MIDFLQYVLIVIGVVFIGLGLSLKAILIALYNSLSAEDRAEIDADPVRKDFYDKVTAKRSTLTTKEDRRKHLAFVILRSLCGLVGVLLVFVGLV